MAFKIPGLSVKTYKMMNRLFSSTGARRGLINVQNNDGLRTITMNDTKTRNALSLRMMEELIEAINVDKDSGELRSIVIRAADGPVFSAGHNLKELTSDQGIDKQRKIFQTCGQLMMSIQKAEVPVIAAVDGLAAAAGCQLVAACDIAVASEMSKFSTPGASFGIFCTTPGVSVSRKANRATAAYMVLTGLPITASEAHQAGLISRVVQQNKLDQTVLEIYESIKSKSRPIVKLGKDFFHRQLEMPYTEALNQGSEIMVKNLQFKDAQEGLQSFKEKRKPKWTHQNQ